MSQPSGPSRSIRPIANPHAAHPERARPHVAAAPATAARPEPAGTGFESWLAARCAGPMARGSVVVHAPATAFQAPGGGECQLVQTGRHVEALGVPVRPFVPWSDRLERGRLLHLFGLSREGLELARVARARKVPVVVSPICWIEPRARWALARGGFRRVVDQARWAARACAPVRLGWRCELLGLADLVLPNSESEATQLVRHFGVDPGRIQVVPNGVEGRFAHADPAPFRRHVGLDAFVLYAGRIEPRKNVLGLIRACRAAGRTLVVVGDAVPGHERYEASCRRVGGATARFIGRLGHDDPLLASAYAAARVFALPSWFETPGLAALEAALAGTAVVVTPFGSTRDYFGDRVGYARPDRPAEIAAAIESAWEAGPDPALAGHVRDHYLWPEVAQRTVEAYARVAP